MIYRESKRSDGSVLYGTDVCGPPNRARVVLGWAPREESFEDRYVAWWLRRHGPWPISEVNYLLRGSGE